MNESETSTPTLLDSAKADKAALAMQLRRSQHNQQMDQMTLDHNRRYRENNQRLYEARMKKFGADGAGPQKGDDMGDINIDSPVTINHPPPKASAALGTLGKAALGLGLLGSGLGGGLLLNQFLNRPTTTTSSPSTTVNAGGPGFDFELEQGKPK